MHAYIEDHQRVKRARIFIMKVGYIIWCNFFNNKWILINLKVLESRVVPLPFRSVSARFLHLEVCSNWATFEKNSNFTGNSPHVSLQTRWTSLPKIENYQILKWHLFFREIKPLKVCLLQIWCFIEQKCTCTLHTTAIARVWFAYWEPKNGFCCGLPDFLVD